MTDYYVTDGIYVNVPWSGTAPSEVRIRIWKPDGTLLSDNDLADGVELIDGNYRTLFTADTYGLYKVAATVTSNGINKTTVFFFYAQPI